MWSDGAGDRPTVLEVNARFSNFTPQLHYYYTWLNVDEVFNITSLIIRNFEFDLHVFSVIKRICDDSGVDYLK